MKLSFRFLLSLTLIVGAFSLFGLFVGSFNDLAASRVEWLLVIIPLLASLIAYYLNEKRAPWAIGVLVAALLVSLSFIAVANYEASLIGNTYGEATSQIDAISKCKHLAYTTLITGEKQQLSSCWNFAALDKCDVSLCQNIKDEEKVNTCRTFFAGQSEFHCPN